MTASCSGEVGVGVSRVQGRVAAPGPRPGHVPFEEVQEGEGKVGVAGGGRYDGVNMGMGPMLLIGVKTCNCYDKFVLCLAGLDKPSRERVNPQLIGGYQYSLCTEQTDSMRLH